MSWAEFLCGPVRAHDVELAANIVNEPEPFMGSDAALTVRLFGLARRRRGSLADCMIAATAIRVGAPLATTNIDDFHRFEPAGLKLA